MVANAERANAANEYATVTSIPIADQIARDLLPAAGRRQLVGNPFGGGLRRDTEPQDLSPAAHDEQPIEQLKRNGRHQEQIHRCNTIRMIAQERLPTLDGGPLLRTIYLATLVCPTSIPSLSNSP